MLESGICIDRTCSHFRVRPIANQREWNIHDRELAPTPGCNQRPRSDNVLRPYHSSWEHPEGGIWPRGLAALAAGFASVVRASRCSLESKKLLAPWAQHGSRPTISF